MHIKIKTHKMEFSFNANTSETGVYSGNKAFFYLSHIILDCNLDPCIKQMLQTFYAANINTRTIELTMEP